MKKLLLTLAFAVAATVSAFAQIGVTAGYATSTTSYIVGSSSYKDPAMNGAFVEGFYQLPVSSILSIEPGIRYTFLTGKTSGSLMGATLTGTATEHYIGVPVMAHLQFEFGNDMAFFAFAGPTFEYGISGTYTTSISAGGSSASKPSQLFDDSYSALDMLIGAGAGLEFHNFRLSAGYHYGFLDRNPKSSDNVTRDAQFLVGLSLLF